MRLAAQAGVEVPVHGMVYFVLPNAEEELALPLRGEKRRLDREDLVDYFGRERLGLTDRVVARVLGEIEAAQPGWEETIGRSFLSERQKARYLEVARERRDRLFG